MRLLTLSASILLLGAFVSASADTKPVERRVLGELGQAIQETKIYAKTATNSRVYSTAKQFQYLVVKELETPNWVGVVLVNGQMGYIPSKSVAVLPYEVTADATKQDSQPSISGTGSLAVDKMLNYGTGFIGTKYVWGGNSLTKGIDCSAFVLQLYKTVGINLPRTAAEQANVGQKIERLEDLQPGDRLYFWSSKRGKIGHTGIFLGYSKRGPLFIHSSTNNNGVAIDDLSKGSWLKTLVGARRSKMPY